MDNNQNNQDQNNQDQSNQNQYQGSQQQNEQSHYQYQNNQYQNNQYQGGQYQNEQPNIFQQSVNQKMGEVKSTFMAGGGLYANIGNKICAIAHIMCWIGIICSVIFGLGMMISGSRTAALIGSSGVAPVLGGFFFIIIGSIGSWMGSMCLYGFGHLINLLQEIEKNTRH